MELVEDYGITIAVASAEEAIALRRADIADDVTLVRVQRPPAEAWDDLASAGFIRKPAWVQWVAPAGTDLEQFLLNMPLKARQDMRRARRRAEEQGLRYELEQPVDPERLDLLLDLYQARVGEMRHGISFATQMRDGILADGRNFAVYAYDGDKMVGGCICMEAADRDVVVIRFSAVDPHWREQSLARALYSEGVLAAQAKGYGKASLGRDPNLYGHLPQPGLLIFKSRLGFRPLPSHQFGHVDSGDDAELLLSLDQLNDPAMILGYGSGEGFRLNVFAHEPADSYDSYKAPFIDEIAVRRPGFLHAE